MKKYLIVILITSAGWLHASAQEEWAKNSIKFYISPTEINAMNAALPSEMWNRLYRKMSQLVNQTGIVEIGYSTFLISPKLDVINVSSSNAGVERVFLAECELTILIKRTSLDPNIGEAVFNSFSKSIMGSGSTKNEAITNALTNLSANDKDIVAFLSDSKGKITKYFSLHCDDVLKEADRALELKNYEQSIALYFSIPSDATCATKAYNASQKVYKTYVKDQCEKKLIRLRTFVALAQTENNAAKNYYDSVLTIMNSLSPSSEKCYEEAKEELTKIESRLSDERKQKWEYIKKHSSDEVEMKKEMYKAMGRINNTYQPNNIIIAH